MKNVLVVAGSVTAGLLLADAITKGAVHTAVIEGFESLVGKAADTVEEAVDEAAEG